MNQRPAMTESEHLARRELLEIVEKMLSGQISFLDGSYRVYGLRSKLGGVLDFDEDFMPFVAVVSETDNFPLAPQRHLWDPDALRQLEPEIEKAEMWAKSVAADACRTLIARFQTEEADASKSSTHEVAAKREHDT